jgi:hypothetical protein
MNWISSIDLLLARKGSLFFASYVIWQCFLNYMDYIARNGRMIIKVKFRLMWMEVFTICFHPSIGWRNWGQPRNIYQYKYLEAGGFALPPPQTRSSIANELRSSLSGRSLFASALRVSSPWIYAMRTSAVWQYDRRTGYTAHAMAQAR